MRLTAPGGAVERVLIELRHDAMARRRIGLYALIAALTIGGGWTLISFITEWRGRNLAVDAAALARHSTASENAARIRALGRSLAAEEPGFGGSLSYWEARAQILALAAARRGDDPAAAQTLYQQAEDSARRGLLISPIGAQTWRQLAEIEAARANWANDPAQALAKTAREVAAADPEAALWQAEFALRHWADLGLDMRRPALEDLAAVAKLGGVWRRRAGDVAAAATDSEAQEAVRARVPELAAPIVAPAPPEPAPVEPLEGAGSP
jgi:hypothetical protein